MVAVRLVPSGFADKVSIVFEFGEKLSKQFGAEKKLLYKFGQSFYYAVHRGEMAEWFNAPVLKTGEG
jgi:hypothetical protein